SMRLGVLLAIDFRRSARSRWERACFGRACSWIFASVPLTAGCTVLPVATVFERPAARDFFPLHPGTLWVYEVRDADGRVALERVLVRGSYRLQMRGGDATNVAESGGATSEM